jgi:hypothetical protein
MTLGHPTSAFAAPSGTQSVQTVPYNGFVNLELKGMTPNSFLKVRVSTGVADPYRDIPGLTEIDRNGNASYSITPIVAVDRNYQGPLWIEVCDLSGNCVTFYVTVGARAPDIIANNNQQERIGCEILNYIAHTRYPGQNALTVLRLLGPDNVAQLAFRCGYYELEVAILIDWIFPL